MNEMMVFENEQFGKIRTVSIDGEPWFVAKDVCDVFSATNRNRIMSQLDDDEKGYTQMITPGGEQSFSVVNEFGLYSMLFAMEPSKARGVPGEYVEKRVAQLKAFKRWVTRDVLPSIRKNGMYMTPEKATEIVEDPFNGMTDVLNAAKEQYEKIRAENEKLTDDTRRAEAETERLRRKLFIRDNQKTIFDFINKCVRSHAGCNGKIIPYAWNDYYDELERRIGHDVREFSKPYLKHLTDEEMGTAIRLASEFSVRDFHVLISDSILDVLKQVVNAA